MYFKRPAGSYCLVEGATKSNSYKQCHGLEHVTIFSLFFISTLDSSEFVSVPSPRRPHSFVNKCPIPIPVVPEMLLLLQMVTPQTLLLFPRPKTAELSLP
jgi:hypothetical protein